MGIKLMMGVKKKHWSNVMEGDRTELRAAASYHTPSGC